MTNQELVDLFNSLFPIGSMVSLRKVASKQFPYEHYKVRDNAFIASSGEAVAFFEGISGYFSIRPDFIQYPPKVQPTVVINSEVKSELTDEIIKKVYEDLALYEKEVCIHNDNLIKSFGKTAKKHFIDLIDFCNVTEKIQLVDSPKGVKQDEKFGIFKNIHVDQWSVGMEGDSYEGFIYANVKGQWIKIPYSC